VTGPHIEAETRRGANYVRVSVVTTVDAADIARALTAAWRVFRWAACDDAGGWDMSAASAEVRPREPLTRRRLWHPWLVLADALDLAEPVLPPRSPPVSPAHYRVCADHAGCVHRVSLETHADVPGRNSVIMHEALQPT
jgi:hypothetical protein